MNQTSTPTEVAGRTRRRGLATVLLLIAALSGAILFSDWVGRRHVRADHVALCTSVARILNPASSTFQVNLSDASEREGFVKVFYSVTTGAMRPRRRNLACRFAPSDGPFTPPRFASIVSDGMPLAAARIGLINRFWLNSSEIAEPLPQTEPVQPVATKPAGAV